MVHFKSELSRYSLPTIKYFSVLYLTHTPVKSFILQIDSVLDTISILFLFSTYPKHLVPKMEYQSATIEQLRTVNILSCKRKHLECKRFGATARASASLAGVPAKTFYLRAKLKYRTLDLRHRGLVCYLAGQVKNSYSSWPIINTKAWLHNLGYKSDSSVGFLTFESWFVMGELIIRL